MLISAQNTAVGRGGATLVSGVATVKCFLLGRPVHLHRTILCQEFTAELISVSLRLMHWITVKGFQWRLGRSRARCPVRGPITPSAQLKELALSSRGSLLRAALVRPLTLPVQLWLIVLDVVPVRGVALALRLIDVEVVFLLLFNRRFATLFLLIAHLIWSWRELSVLR